jgi:iron complex outermembrane receptor protein
MYRHASIAVGVPYGGAPYFSDANGNPCHPNDPCVPLTGGLTGPVFQNDIGQEKASKVTWRAAVDYQLTQDQMVYGYVATGYKAGSFNDVCPSTGQPCSYGPESMTAYELGYKGKVLPNLQFTTAFYYYDYSKFQLTEPTFLAQSANGGPPTVVIYTNLVPVALYGWEGEMHWNITPNDIFHWSATIANGYYRGGPNHATAGLDGAIRVDMTGWRLDQLPPVVNILSYEHLFGLPNGGNISARLNTKISGGYYESELAGVTAGGPPFLGSQAGTFYATPPQQYYQKSFHRTDFTLRYNAPSGKYDAYAFVRNIENKMQIEGAPRNLPGPGGDPDAVSIPINAPRTYGVHVDLKF